MSATFAASLVTSPAIGAYLSQAYGDTLVVVLASGVALLDIGFILLAVPESLPEEMRPVSWGAPISWEQADPFAVSNLAAVFLHSGDICRCFSSAVSSLKRKMHSTKDQGECWQRYSV